MGTSRIILQAGTPAVSSQALKLLPINSSGDPTALRRLVYPTAASALIAPLVYASGGLNQNPTRTLNFHREPLLKRQTTPVKTLGSTQLVDFTDKLEDVLITEVWSAESGFSMTAAMWRELKAYYDNPPDPTLGVFVQWEPRDETTKVYNVQIVSITPGDYDILEVVGRGGGTIATATSGLEPTSTGLIDTEVRLVLRIVSEV